MRRFISFLSIYLLLLNLSCSNQKEKQNVDSTNTINKDEEQSNLIGKKVKVYTTAKELIKDLLLDGQDTFTEAEQPREDEISVFVNPAKTFQEYIGIGGAITDASAEVFSQLSKKNQEELLNAYFHEDGINYNIIRTSIHSADFGLGSFTYIEEGDDKLETFSIAKDKEKRIPMIKKAQAIIGDDMMFYASPWSPPAFMKTNKNMLTRRKAVT